MLSILFVEDDTTIAMGVEYSLKQDGFQVSLAYRLEEARDLLKRQPFYAVKYEGRTFDCGSKVGFLTANVAYALARPDISDAVTAEIKKLL